MTTPKIFLSIILIISCLNPGRAQVKNNVMRFDEQRSQQKRNNILIQDVNGYKVLKCDFHMHTVFSDGTVWPNIRLQEAWTEGLDAIALTDHMEGHPHRNEVSTDNNLPHELIRNEASKNNIILIKGTEVTRQTPPGHFNAIFTGDLSGYVTDNTTGEKDREAVMKAAAQNAFIFWNHPGWKPNIEGSYEWLPFVEDLYKNKVLKGIEVFNGFGFHMKALDWCIDKGLTVMGNTDAHNLNRHTYDQDNDYVHRTMTLVFAKERSAESIREALEAGRTVAWAGKYLAGKEENVRKLFNACVETGQSHYSEKPKTGNLLKYYEISNNSDLYFDLELRSGKGTPEFILYPRSTQVISAEEGQSVLRYEVMTAFIRSDKHLQVDLVLK